ncbi:U6 snRNA phosphodiesterase [Solanum pennellii]|uniref:U6 snRNA phosphodiesterase n=1 Tax=Solanum pennellii TaxID=28526 RepID=A0ABM1G9N6_SOLPN|nr:U6 snRNA phosphodiesterase [Solanum pennellii]
MEALLASYADDSSDTGSDSDSNPTPPQPPSASTSLAPLPPPPISLLQPPNSFVSLDSLPSIQVDRVRSFPHIEGNYALHVYIPVYIPSATRKGLVRFLKKVTAIVPTLYAVDVDVPLSGLLKDEALLEKVVLGREFHISLGRTVPLRVHQINSVVSMLRQRLQFQRRYLIDFNKWEIFVNDDSTRTFMSLEVLEGGLAQIRRQIQAVDEVYKLHNLPEFYKDPRPHISITWALGDISDTLKRMVEEEMIKYRAGPSSRQKCIFTSKFSGISCKIGNKMHEICKFQEE